MYNPQQIFDALRQVEDPDLKKDLVTLGMIRDLRTEGKKISFTVMLTTPSCPMKDHIRNACFNAVKHLVDQEAEIDITMSAEVTSGFRKNGLPSVKNIIAVASGKGGVGKSTVASNLAVSLALSGASVGLLDADIYGPSMPLMFGLSDERPAASLENGKQVIHPLVKFGVRIMSIGFLTDPSQAIVWRGPMASKAMTQFLFDVKWEELDYLILDLPPGTGDIHLSMVQQVPVTGAVIVTTPQDVAVADARKAVAMFRTPSIQVPVLGIVENMSWFSPPDDPGKKYHLFGKGGGRRLAAESEVPFLGEIPLEESAREGSDLGMPAVLNEESQAGPAFRNIAMEVARQISILNAQQLKAGVSPA